MIESSVLALDCAMGACSAGAYNANTQQICALSEQMERGHAQHLMPMVQSVMDQAGMGFDDLDLVVSTIGPGSFTGVRVGLSAAKALALALDIPLCGLETPAILAQQFFSENNLPGTQSLCVLVETRREDFYMQTYDAQGQAAGPVQSLFAAEIKTVFRGKSVIFTGDAARRFYTAPDAKSEGEDWHLRDAYHAPGIQSMIDIALLNVGADCGKNYQFCEPVYLRGAKVSKPKHVFRQLK